MFSWHMGEKKIGLVTSVDWMHGSWVDEYSCLHLHTHVIQVSCCDHCNPHFFVHTRICIYHASVDRLVYLQVKNKQNSGIAFRAFILGTAWRLHE
jgi:hypothetical protein